MAYSEENGAVVLRMSKEDFNDIDTVLKGYAATTKLRENRERMKQILDRLNQGNPNYTPSQVKP